MAINAAFGFRPVRYLDGSPYNGAVTHFPKNNSTEIAKGDPLLANASGEVVRASASGDLVLGYCMGCETTGANGTINFVNRLGTTDSGVVHVALAQDLVCLVQMGDGHVATAADVFAGAEAVSATPSTAYGVSRYELSSFIGAGAATYTIVGIDTSPDNTATATFRNVLVVAGETRFHAAAPTPV